MDPDAIVLFRELADRSSSDREEYYARHQVPAAVRAQVESLLRVWPGCRRNRSRVGKPSHRRGWRRRGRRFLWCAGAKRNGVPVIELGGVSDTDDRGRWIPTASVEQYGANLASWFGVAADDLGVVFPNIGRFPTSTLGFMG